MSFAEARRLMRLVNVEALKRKLGMEGKEVIEYFELIQACESLGVARSNEEAASFAQVLDEAGVILLFHNKVYLHPDKVEISLIEHLCREAKIGPKAHKLR
ncbi:calcium uniporter protein 5 [Quercus suber]|uniref:Calcium uniporter protein 5 n=1 Tax=Quercus suber TaxID=58331 RepID=A0AAW0M645_QUESU